MGRYTAIQLGLHLGLDLVPNLANVRLGHLFPRLVPQHLAGPEARPPYIDELGRETHVKNPRLKQQQQGHDGDGQKGNAQLVDQAIDAGEGEGHRVDVLPVDTGDADDVGVVLEGHPDHGGGEGLELVTPVEALADAGDALGVDQDIGLGLPHEGLEVEPGGVQRPYPLPEVAQLEGVHQLGGREHGGRQGPEKLAQVELMLVKQARAQHDGIPREGHPGVVAGIDQGPLGVAAGGHLIKPDEYRPEVPAQRLDDLLPQTAQEALVKEARQLPRVGREGSFELLGIHVPIGLAAQNGRGSSRLSHSAKVAEKAGNPGIPPGRLFQYTGIWGIKKARNGQAGIV